MAQKAKLVQVSLAQGEVSEEIEARTDVAKRYNGVRVMENFWVLPEGGSIRRPGLQYICEVKDSSKFTMAIPFEHDVTDAFGIEAGEGYFRFLKNRAPVLDGVVPFEILTSPYQEADLRDIHYQQSADFIFMCNPNPAYDIQKLARITDANWTLANFNADPPPSFDADEDLAVAGALGANTGMDIKFRTVSDVLLAGDEGRQLIAGTGRAVITAIDNARQATVDMLDDFAQTITADPVALSSAGTTVTVVGHVAEVGNAVLLTSGAQAGEIRMITAVPTPDTFEIDAAFSAGQAGVTWDLISGFAASGWLLRLAPQVAFDVNKKEPVGRVVTFTTSGVAALRTAYAGKFVKLLGGTIEITEVTSPTGGKGVIKSILTDASGANPDAVAAGAWRLQESSWSATRGRPQTVTIHQGRLVFAGTPTQPKTLWGPSYNDIYNFATGALPTDAYEYTFNDGGLDPLQWLVSLGSLYIGNAKQEYAARGQGADAPLGGDETPFVSKISKAGSMHAQPIVVDNAILIIQRYGRDIVQLAYSLQDSPDASSFVPSEPTLFARQISDMGFAKHAPAYWQKPNSIIFYPLDNGHLAGLTFKPRQEILAWARTVTDGDIESVIVLPHEGGKRQTMLCIVKRTINGETKRFWEYFEDDSSTMSARAFSDLQTDCAKVGTIAAAATTISGLDHLEGETVDVIIGSNAIAQKVVTGGVVTLDADEAPENDTVYEVGLHFTSTLTTLRPAIPNEVTEPLKRAWDIVRVRLKNTIGGTLNGKPLKPTGTTRPFTGLASMENVRTDDDFDGALTIQQTQPYPMQILGISGRVSFGDEIS